MIAAIILFLYFFWLFMAFGFAALTGLNRFLRNDQPGLPILVVTILGLGVVSVFASAMHLFINLGLSFSILATAGGALIHVRMNPFRGLKIPKLPAAVWILALVIFLTVLELSTHRPAASDTALYHAQTIRWFETYPIVPGLGNLHHRLAFNSSWLVLNAALSFSFLEFRSFHLVSGFFFLVAQLFFLGGVNALFQGKLSWSSLFKTISIPLSFYLFSSVVSSPAYDMPVALLTWLIVALWLEATEDVSRSSGIEIAVFLLCFYAVTVKLSALPLLLFPTWILASKLKAGDKRIAAALIASAFAIFLPFAARSVMLSGYLVFPISELDFFSFDWKIPVGRVEEIRDGIVGFARLPGKDFESATRMTLAEWFPLWFDNLTTNQRMIFILTALSPFFTGWLGVIRSKAPTRRQFFSYFVLFVGALFWFLSAPDIRFGYGFLAGFLLWIVSLGLVVLARRVPSSLERSKRTALFGLILFQIYSLSFSVEYTTLAGRMIFPADYFNSRAEPCGLKNGTVYCRVEGGQCSYEIFPCIPSPRPNVELRGSAFREGFHDAPR